MAHTFCFFHRQTHTSVTTDKVLTDSVAQLTQAVVARLRVASVEAGVGVDAAMMEVGRLKQTAPWRHARTHTGHIPLVSMCRQACLLRMKQHADAAAAAGRAAATTTGSGSGSGSGSADQGHAGKLAALAGMRVRVGRYLGIADDGSVTWPHDFPDLR